MPQFTDVAHRVRSLFGHAGSAAAADELEARMLAAEQLAQSEERLRLAMEATALGTFEWEIATDRVQCSPSVKKQFGFSSEEALTLESVVSRIHPADREAVRTTIRAAMDATGSRTYAGEFRTLLPNGHSGWIDARGAVLFSDLNTRPQRMIGIVLDITARKIQQLRLDRGVSDLSTANRLKDEFLATLAHKLRHPLTPIRNGLDILALTGFADPTQRKACELMGRQVRLLVHFVDELLDASLVSRGTLALHRELVALQSLIRRAVDVVREQLDESGHELRFEVTHAPVLLHVDPQRIAQAIANVLENAIRYTPAPGRIIVRAGADANGAAIQVVDNGAGVPPMLRPHLFELFAMRLPSDQAHVSGLGLGLALANSLVRMHGGSISVASEGVGTGSAFRIWLPVATPPVAGITRGIGWRGSLPRRRVLVVDGDPDSAELNLTLLKLMGQDVRHARNEAAALEIAAQFIPQIVFAAEGSDEVNGSRILRSIGAAPLPERPVLVLVGDDPDVAPDSSPDSSHGASDFDTHLRTPVDAAAIARVISHPPPHSRAPARVADDKRETAS